MLIKLSSLASSIKHLHCIRLPWNQLVILSQTWFECLLNGHCSSTKLTFSRLEKEAQRGLLRCLFIYKWVWIIYFLSDFDEVVIPAYDSIGAYSFQVGPSVSPLVKFLIDWLVGWFIRSSVLLQIVNATSVIISVWVMGLYLHAISI